MARRSPRIRRAAPAALQAAAALAADWYWEAGEDHAVRRVDYSPQYAVPRGHGVGWFTGGPSPNPAGGRWDDVHRAMDARETFRAIETIQRDAVGRRRHLLLSGEPVWSPSGRYMGYRGVGRDITAQRDTESALNASESQLAAIIDAAVEAVVTVDANGRIVVFNRAAGDLFGCGRADALGQPLSRFIPRAEKHIAQRPTQAGPAPQCIARALAVTCQRVDGSETPAEASISRVELAGGCLYTIVLRDLSSQQAAEQARAALELQLRQSQKMEALGTMAGGIAHDFNNIVAAILGNAALAQAQLGRTPPARFVQEIAKAALRARDLVQRILAFSRKQPAVFSCQPFQPLVEEGVQLLRATLPSGIEVVARLTKEPAHVRADPSQISQVLMNLGTNAWQALGSRPGRIEVDLRVEGAEVVLAVADNGCGMDEATQQRIFEPFFTTKAKGEGTGLGLPVVHGIVQGHGGRITVRSRKGEGSCFEVHLPLAQPDAGEPAKDTTRSPAAPARGEGRHIVYLDDYPAMVFMVRATLETLGYRVSGFEDPDQAMAYLERHAHEVDLVVTDHNMPGHSGLEIAAMVQRLYPRVPVVLASGYITDELREDAVRAGVKQVFDKPRGIEELCVLVGQVLEKQQAETGDAR
jgi:PAS domain S-box-containing protein